MIHPLQILGLQPQKYAKIHNYIYIYSFCFLPVRVLCALEPYMESDFAETQVIYFYLFITN